MVKKAINLIVISEALVLLTNLISFEFYINLQVAFLSSLFVILGASYGYKKMVNSQVSSGEFEDKRDLLDEIEDPHALYDDEALNEAPYEELDLKQIVKEERAKIKTFSLKSAKQGAKGSVSAFRLVPYVFLILGFIALKNNELLDISIYLPSLLVGIVVGSVLGREIFS
jgi:hypothetical protein